MVFGSVFTLATFVLVAVVAHFNSFHETSFSLLFTKAVAIDTPVDLES